MRHVAEEVPGAVPPFGAWGIDGLFTNPQPPPFTTIGWRLNHMTIVMAGYSELLGAPLGRVEVEASAQTAVRAWQTTAAALAERVRDLTSEAAIELVEIKHWGRSVPRWTIVGHVLREQLHHSAEIGVVWDLFRYQG